MILEYANYKNNELTVNPTRLDDTMSVTLAELVEGAKERLGEALSAPINDDEERQAIITLGDEVNNG